MTGTTTKSICDGEESVSDAARGPKGVKKRGEMRRVRGRGRQALVDDGVTLLRGLPRSITGKRQKNSCMIHSVDRETRKHYKQT